MKDLTAKEKAKELVSTYYSLISGLPINFVSKLIALPNGDSYYEIAKQCALIAVDEILKSHYKLFTGVKPSIYKYYEEVKSEIEKL